MRRFTRACLGRFLISFVFCAAAPFELPAAEPDDNVIETFKVARHGDCLLVPVKFGGEEYQFLVDTGFTCSAIDSTLKSHLDPQPRFARLNGQSRQKLYHLRDGLVGNSRQLFTGDAICLDLSRFREASGYDIRGILGMGFLKTQVMRIDFDTGIFSILKRVPTSAGSVFRLSYNREELPLLNVEIEDGETVAWIIDTGKIGRSLTLRKYLFDAVMENDRLELNGPPALFAVVEGDIKFRNGRLDTFCLGEFIHERIDVNEGTTNLIGMQLLSRFIVTFDFSEDRLYLKPGLRFAEPNKLGWCGLAICRINGGTSIKDVDEDSVAERAGLKAGDAILRIDGKNASSMTLFEIRAILRSDGRRVRLDVEGPAGRREVEIRISGPLAD